MTTVTFTAGLPGDAPHEYRKILVVLVDGGAGASDGEKVIGGTRVVKLDEDGTGALVLEDNDAITPAGTFYRATLDGASPPLVRNFSLASDTVSPVSWAEPTIQVESPVPPSFAVSVDGAIADAAAALAAVDGKEDVGVAAALVAPKLDADDPAVVTDLSTAIDAVTTGDLFLAAGNRTAVPGTVQGGVVRESNGIIVPWTHDATAQPTDIAMGTAFYARWDGSVQAMGGLGPSVATGDFGPRAFFTAEGNLKYNTNQTAFGFDPVAFVDTIKIGNAPGTNRNMSPAWSYISARVRYADDGVVTYIANDTNRGGAAFVDTPVYITENGGEIDAHTNLVKLHHFYAGGVVSGDIDFYRRVVYGGDDILHGRDPAYGGPGTYRDILTGQHPNADVDTSRIREQVFLEIPHLVGGELNLGIENGSGYRDIPIGQTLTVVGDTLRIDCTALHLVNAGSALTLTSVPTIPAGLNGQRLKITNLLNDVTLQGAATLTGSRLAETITLKSGDTVELQYTEAAGLWVIASAHMKITRHREGLVVNDGTSAASLTSLSPTGQSTFQQAGHVNPMYGSGILFGSIPFVGFGAGGATAMDAFLSRAGAEIIQMGLSGNGFIRGGVQHASRTVTAATDTLVLADGPKSLTYNRATAIAATLPQNSSVAIPATVRIPVANIGAGTVTFAAGSGATLVTGSPTTLTQGQAGYLTKPNPADLNLWMLIRA